MPWRINNSRESYSNKLWRCEMLSSCRQEPYSCLSSQNDDWWNFTFTSWQSILSVHTHHAVLPSVTVKFVLTALRCCPPGFRLCGMTLLNEGVVARFECPWYRCNYSQHVCHGGVSSCHWWFFPIVNVEHQLITQCIINSYELASFKLWTLT